MRFNKIIFSQAFFHTVYLHLKYLRGNSSWSKLAIKSFLVKIIAEQTI